ncbi:MAG: DUF4380 domain-containing protein [Planctomycetota bacterium]|nr:DUF4380 domain-containing protein [Planctomycetota bacterium]
MHAAASQYVLLRPRSPAWWHAHSLPALWRAAVRVGMHGAGGINMPRQSRRAGRHATLLVGAALLFLAAVPALGAGTSKSTYRGWESLALSNGLVEVQIVPQIGGRVIQFKLGDFEFLWVNPQLAGKLPPPSGLGPKGEWLNYGGDKLWPAPQGWDNDQQWPGPPDAVLDGGPHRGRIVVEKADDMHTVSLDSPEDKRSGIQFTRWIRVYTGSRGGANVTFDTTMKNIDTKPRRWGIWQVTQINACNRAGDGYNKEIRCWSPVNPASIYPRGYCEMFGLVNNPSFRVDPATKMFSANYKRIVGKVGLDNSAGWVAVVDGTAGYVFVERFEHYPDKKYPDQASVEFWMNGTGQIVTGDKIVDCKDDPVETPYLVETEILSPFAELRPGDSYSFRLDWFAARIGGNYPVLACTDRGVTCEPLTAKAAVDGKVHLAGRFGVFYVARAAVVALDGDGKDLETIDLKLPVSPLEALVLEKDEPLPPKAASVRLVLLDSAGKEIGELARTQIAK